MLRGEGNLVARKKLHPQTKLTDKNPAQDKGRYSMKT